MPSRVQNLLLQDSVEDYSIPGKMKELGYDTTEIMKNAGTLILTIQVWLVGVLIYAILIPIVMLLL